jgi:hypothetical protein
MGSQWAHADVNALATVIRQITAMATKGVYRSACNGSAGRRPCVRLADVPTWTTASGTLLATTGKIRTQRTGAASQRPGWRPIGT